MKPNPKSVRLWLVRDDRDGVVYPRRHKNAAREWAKIVKGTYLGEYIARPVVKKKGKRRGK